MLLSAVVLVKDEVEKIHGCLASLKFCDEILVIKDGSLESIDEIAKKEGAKVYNHLLNDNFSDQRNFGLNKAKGDWILFIDADEEVTKDLAEEIINKIDGSENTNGFYLRRNDFLWGRTITHGEVGSVKLLRLAKRNKGSWQRKVHEYWDIKGNVAELNHTIMHFSHQNLREFIDHINRFSSLHAEANYEEGKRSDPFKIIFYPILKFIDNFILKDGFLDSIQGFIFALVMSFHSFLSWSNLWILQKQRNKTL